MHGRLDTLVGGVAVSLLAERALLLREERVLVVADVHFGKDSTFRARGIPVPAGTTGVDLARLDRLLHATAASTLVFLGDLFHAHEAHRAESQQLRRWRAGHAHVDMVLVEGNHDRHAGRPAPEAGIRVEDEPFGLGPLALCHHPQHVEGAHVLAGHLHPCVRLYGVANDSMRLPCFWLQPQLAILPAFGEFTGGARITRSEGDRVIAVAEDRLYELPPLPAARRQAA
jgi:DNA ligase-associated metallophosphoesterase